MIRRINTLILTVLLLMLSGCSNIPETGTKQATEAPAYRFAMVVKDTSNPYMMHMYSGFESACSELDATCLIAGPDYLSAEGQIKSIETLLTQGVNAIAVAANDKDALSAVLSKAIEEGVKVVSLDASVNASDRMVHIQQADPDILGRVLIQAAREMINGDGEVAVLTTTENAPNQSLWLSWILKEMEENTEIYGDIKLVEIAYGNDDRATSRQEMQKMLAEYPELDIVIALSNVAIRSAAEVIQETDSDVLVTGLGLPSEMYEYVIDGICPWMYLWNPIDVGYISAYACHGLVEGGITGECGEIVHAGKIGDKRIQNCADGGTEIVVGNPCMFDPENISVWREIF